MLVSFSVSNFRSFGDEQTLDMVASNKIAGKEGHRVPIGHTGSYVVRAAVVYGANAAGKSNLILAMSYARALISERREHVFPASPFRFQPAVASKPSSFEFRILIDDRVFIYGFDISINRIISEWLALKLGDDEIDIVTRGDDGIASINETAKVHFPDDAVMFNALDKLKGLPFKSEHLFLNRASSIPAKALGKTLSSIIRWFEHSLKVVSTEDRICDLMDRLSGDDTFRSFCSGFLGNVGTGVSALKIDTKERDANDYERPYLDHMSKFGASFFSPYGCDTDTDICLVKDNPTRVIERKLLAEHATKTQRYSLPFGEESDGTKSLLHLLPTLSSPPGESLVVVIDELDRSLHPLLCWELVRFFSESCPGSRKQMIVTTHEAHLLNQDLLRRDEYWFIEKDQMQQSRLVSLSDFNIRNDLQIQKGYLQGRFGAIPMIGGMHELERLLACSGTEEENAAKETTT